MASSNGSSSRLKSAYETALERLEAEGIAAPDETALSAETREAVATARRKAEAKRAELEILHRKELAATVEPGDRDRLEKRYVAERRRIDADLEREIERLRREGAS